MAEKSALSDTFEANLRVKSFGSGVVKIYYKTEFCMSFGENFIAHSFN